MVGNLPNFSKIDVLRCLLAIEKPVSRSYLSKDLELGEGTIRSILDILKKRGFLISDNMGHSLSKKGRDALNIIKKILAIKKIDEIPFIPNKKIVALQIKNPKKTEKAFVLRDWAIRNGAEGALILQYENGLKFYELEHDEDLSNIENEFELNKNDIVIVAYSNSYKMAEHGAVAASILINDVLNDFINKF